MKDNKKSFKIILSSMITFQLLFCLFSGFIIAEKNTRKIGFNDHSPWFVAKNDEKEHFIKFKFMNQFLTLDFSLPYKKLDAVSKYFFDNYIKIKNNLYCK